MIVNNLVIGLGHGYFDIVGNEQHIKFHIDYCNRIRGRSSAFTRGWKMSYRQPACGRLQKQDRS